MNDMTDATPDDLTTFMRHTMPFTEVLGIEPITATPEDVRARVAWDATRCTAGGVMHGGLLMALADTTGAWCAFLNIAQGALTTTIESKTNFLRAVRNGYVEARSRPLHVGRTIVVIDTDIYADNDKLVARVTQTQAVITS